jgi:hypothetical protein
MRQSSREELLLCKNRGLLLRINQQVLWILLRSVLRLLLGENLAMTQGVDKFDYRSYIRKKAFKILDRNEGVKLTRKTLGSLEMIGFHLVPSPN